MSVQIQLRNDTSSNWTTANPVLAQGEIGIELDTKKMKVGDGIARWNNLAYTTKTRIIDTIIPIAYNQRSIPLSNAPDTTMDIEFFVNGILEEQFTITGNVLTYTGTSYNLSITDILKIKYYK